MTEVSQQKKNSSKNTLWLLGCPWKALFLLTRVKATK